MNQEKIGKFIAELRKEKKMTQQELADKLNVTDRAISKWENGRGLPDIYTMRQLAALFNIKEDELLNGERNFKKKKIDENHHSVVLEVNNLSKRFGNRTVLNNIDLKIYEGDIVGLIGPNGAGKTTLIKTILNLYKYDKGNVRICNYDTKLYLEEALSKIGCIIENPDAYENLSGRKNLEITKLINGIYDDEYVYEIIKLVRLENRINDKVKKYSLGMKQRLGIANALIKKPRLLILDEPTNGLDPAGIKELRQILKTISIEQNMSILISSHILSEIENLCDEILIIDNGRIINKFGIEEIKYKNISLEEKYLDIVNNFENGDKNENI